MPEVGLGLTPGVENTQVVDFAIRSITMIRPTGGFIAQNPAWVVGPSIPEFGSRNRAFRVRSAENVNPWINRRRPLEGFRRAERILYRGLENLGLGGGGLHVSPQVRGLSQFPV